MIIKNFFYVEAFGTAAHIQILDGFKTVIPGVVYEFVMNRSYLKIKVIKKKIMKKEFAQQHTSVCVPLRFQYLQNVYVNSCGKCVK